MEQFNPGNDTIVVDYDDAKYPESFRTLRPVVYKKEGKFQCLLGPDQASGVHTSGSTLEDVLSSWDAALLDRVSTNGNDDITLYIIDSMNASVKKAG